METEALTLEELVEMKVPGLTPSTTMVRDVFVLIEDVGVVFSEEVVLVVIMGSAFFTGGGGGGGFLMGGGGGGFLTGGGGGGFLTGGGGDFFFICGGGVGFTTGAIGILAGDGIVGEGDDGVAVIPGLNETETCASARHLPSSIPACITSSNRQNNDQDTLFPVPFKPLGERN